MMVRKKVGVRLGVMGVLAFGLASGAAFGAELDESTVAAVQQAVQLQTAFRSVAERAFPSVVVITNKQVQAGPQPQMMPPFWQFFEQPDPRQAPPYQGYPGGRQRRPRPRPVGSGSGVVIREEGLILTNYHVIQDADALAVRFQDGRMFDNEADEKAVEVVGVDEETDLAVLRVGQGKEGPFPVLPFADSSEVQVGDWAIAVGAPYELDYSVTVGHVSQRGRHDVGMTTFENYIQTDASINPGNSGGPLLNIHGEVIGINEFIVTGGGMSRGSIGLGFAIASNLAQQVAEDLMEHGEVIRPFLGIGMQPLTPSLRDQFNMDYGVIVSEAIEGNPAAAAGIQAGDVIYRIGDKEVRTPHDLLFAVLEYGPGDTIEVHLDRNGEKKRVEVVATQRGGGRTASRPMGDRQDILDRLGMALEETEEGVYVTGVVAGSPASVAELRRGDRILMVNRTPVETIDEILRAFEKNANDTVLFHIDRRGQKLFVAIPLESEE